MAVSLGLPVVMLAMMVSACGSSSTTESASAPTTAARPSLIADTIDGQQIDFVDVLDEDAVLWFWAPW